MLFPKPSFLSHKPRQIGCVGIVRRDRGCARFYFSRDTGRNRASYTLPGVYNKGLFLIIFVFLTLFPEKGYGKRTFVREFRETKRGSKGVKALNITEKNGRIASFNIVDDEKDIIIITDAGMVIRLATNTVSQLSRIAQGVRLINLKENQLVTSISIVDKESERADEDINDGKNNRAESNDSNGVSDNQDGESIDEQ